MPRPSSTRLITETARDARRMTWQRAAILGAIAFVLFYLVVPALMAALADQAPPGILQRVVKDIILKRIHWSERLGLALLVVCWVVAAWAYLRGPEARARRRQRH